MPSFFPSRRSLSEPEWPSQCQSWCSPFESFPAFSCHITLALHLPNRLHPPKKDYRGFRTAEDRLATESTWKWCMVAKTTKIHGEGGVCASIDSILLLSSAFLALVFSLLVVSQLYIPPLTHVDTYLMAQVRLRNIYTVFKHPLTSRNTSHSLTSSQSRAGPKTTTWRLVTKISGQWQLPLGNRAEFILKA